MPVNPTTSLNCMPTDMIYEGLLIGMDCSVMIWPSTGSTSYHWVVMPSWNASYIPTSCWASPSLDFLMFIEESWSSCWTVKISNFSRSFLDGHSWVQDLLGSPKLTEFVIAGYCISSPPKNSSSCAIICRSSSIYALIPTIDLPSGITWWIQQHSVVNSWASSPLYWTENDFRALVSYGYKRVIESMNFV